MAQTVSSDATLLVFLPERTIAATQPEVQWSDRYEQHQDR